MKGFRPLSGNYISQIMDGEQFAIIKTVSVPCRGTTFLKMNEVLRDFNLQDSFRPLSGNYISQWKTQWEAVEELVSVPCRGTTFLKRRKRYPPKR